MVYTPRLILHCFFMPNCGYISFIKLSNSIAFLIHVTNKWAYCIWCSTQEKEPLCHVQKVKAQIRLPFGKSDQGLLWFSTSMDPINGHWRSWSGCACTGWSALSIAWLYSIRSLFCSLIIALDKEMFWTIKVLIFSFISLQKHVVCTHFKHLIKELLMSTQNMLLKRNIFILLSRANPGLHCSAGLRDTVESDDE